MSTITENLNRIRHTLPSGVRLVAVSKFHPSEAISEAYEAGQRIFGESKAQELRRKSEELPADIEWHFIGHLQSNKIKYIAPYVAMIHSVDSVNLLREIDRAAEKEGRVIDCLLQIYIGKEDSKFGFSTDECMEYLNSGDWKLFRHVRICGVMGMATNTDDETQIYAEFQRLSQFFEEIKHRFFDIEDSFSEISMGMSHDYQLAIKAGSTLVRIGSDIFGERVY